MAAQNIPQIDNLIKEFGKDFQESVKQAGKAIDKAIKGLNHLGRKTAWYIT